MNSCLEVEKKSIEIVEKNNNLEKYEKIEERRTYNLKPPEIIVGESNNITINRYQYDIINNVTNVQQPDDQEEEEEDDDEEDSTFLRKAIKKITENIEYIADQATR